MSITKNNYSLSGYFDIDDLKCENYKTFGKSNRYKVVFLGSLYNKRDINNEEFIFQNYQEHGTDFIKNLNGSFLLVIADLLENILVIARDQFGKYPLFYAVENKKIYFSTDTKTLTNKFKISKNINLEALNYYFALRYIPIDLCIFENIKKLPSGHLLIYDLNEDNLKIDKYYYTPDTDPIIKSEKEVADNLEKLLLQSVEKRVSDKNIGAFLSGGIDSSLNVALLSKYTNDPINTFSIGFKEKKYDESDLSRIVANYFSTKHSELELTPESTEHFEKIGKIFDEPLADPSIIPTYYACKLASENCEEVFCGEGADGLFLGLKTHGYSEKYQNLYSYTKYLFPLLKVIQKSVPDDKIWKIFIKGLTPEQFFLERSINFSSKLREKIFSNDVEQYLQDWSNSPENFIKQIFNSYKGSFKGKMGNFNSTCFTDNALSMRVQMTRYFNLKYMTPFLDKDFTDYSLSEINPELKIKDGIKKYILKKVAKKYLPPSLPIERKRGFNAPIPVWFRNNWWKYSREKILDIHDEIINRKYAEEILNKHKNSSYDLSRKIFTLLMFKLWEEENLT